MIPKLTKQGKDLLNKVLAEGEKIIFTKIQFGNGQPSENIDAVTELGNMRISQTFNAEPKIHEGGYVVLRAAFDNKDIEDGFHVTEVGYFAKDSQGDEILYAISYAEESSADYVPSKSERVLDFEIEAMIFIGDIEDVNAIINDSLDYAPKNELDDHIKRRDNPHEVTKAQVGLGRVPNVYTNDQIVTFDVEETVKNPQLDGFAVGKDTLSVMMSKVYRAMYKLAKHFGASNPHQITPKGIKAAEEKHNHSTDDLNAGKLPVVRGGTGKNYHPKDSIIIGDDYNDLKNIRGTGAVFAEGDQVPKFGILPVECGGTGLDVGAMFDTSNPEHGCYGCINLPGGLLVQWGHLVVPDFKYNNPVHFAAEYADNRYALLFTTTSNMLTGEGPFMGTGDLASWRLPKKHTTHFILDRETPTTARYADWVAIGRAKN